MSIPNRLFFDDDGIITLFEKYKFTVEENTPAEQEVALDPELLGTVFENLLAEINPETKESARKQTGSYYTPRPVVEYMVDEAIVASLSTKVQPRDSDYEKLEKHIRYLLDYNDALDDVGKLFQPEETSQIIGAIANLKVLDPAVGSGAFPMGILHKLTLALSRLDPKNRVWERIQTQIAVERAEQAFGILDQRERDIELTTISDTFERYRESDFGRKLYLIQNSIFGVDIQPIACQIAKLRFFISLAIEQTPSNDRDDNYGIKPLPNLETRFVAANTLVGLENSMQGSLAQTTAINELQLEISNNRERYFHANARQLKLECIQRDTRLRTDLAAALTQVGLPANDADRISRINLYDQNGFADWFDSRYMFGIHGGFDIVVGNPPYKQVRKGVHSSSQFPYSEGKDKGKQNLYKLFVEQSYNLVVNGGIATLIVQSSLMCDESSSATRRLLLEHTQLKHILEFPKSAPTRDVQLFQSVTQGTCVYQFRKQMPVGDPISISVGNHAGSFDQLRFEEIKPSTIGSLYPNLRCFPLIRHGSVAIMEKIARSSTTRPLSHYVEKIVQGDLNISSHSNRYSQIKTSVRLLRGRNVGRFVVKYNISSEYCDEGFRVDKVRENRKHAFLVSQQVTGTNDLRRLHFAVADNPDEDHLCGHSINKTLLKEPKHNKVFCGLLNSKFMDWFFRITSTNNNAQGYELKQLPIPEFDDTTINHLDGLVGRIIAAKAVDYDADTSDLEAEIDQLVYQLYGLTDEEIAAVEANL